MSFFSVMRWLWLLVIGCSAQARGPTPPGLESSACATIEATDAHELFGAVTDAAGRPVENVRVDELMWFQVRAQWRRQVGNHTITARDGTYRLVETSAMLSFTRDDRQVVVVRAFAPRRLDVQLDVTRPAGVVDVVDASTAIERCEAWACPIDRPPPPNWWLAPAPCPRGAHLRFGVAQDLDYAAAAQVRCELDGKPHGPSTTWTLAPDRAWRESDAWFDHGRACGISRDDPATVPLPVDHPST